MVLELKPMGKLITFDKYLSVGQDKGLVWILKPQSLKRLITSSIYLSDEQNLKGVYLLGSRTLSPFDKDVNPSDHKPMRKFTLGASHFLLPIQQKKNLRYVGSLGPSAKC